jgi:transposase InsO family protein
MSRYRFIEAQRGQHPVRLLCQVLGVPTSGYYAWQQVQQQAVAQGEPAWEAALVKVFGRHQRRYGTRRLQVALRRKGYRVGPQRLRGAMRRWGLHALQHKAFTPRTTDSTHGLRCAPNRLLKQPKPTQATQLWVSDITYLPLANGDWAYLCAYQDMVSKQVVGWHVMATMPEELITTALQRAFWAQPSTPDLLVHSDRGGQYCACIASCSTTTRPCARRAAAATATIMRKLRVSGHASKRRCSNCASGPSLPTWPMPKPASPTILTTTITSGCTLASTTRRPIILNSNFFTLTP